MSQHHQIVTPRIARMLRELEGAAAAPDPPADVAKSVIDRGAEMRKRTAAQWFQARAAAVVPLLRVRSS